MIVSALPQNDRAPVSRCPRLPQMVKSDSNTNVGAGGGKSKALATRGPAGRGGAVAR